MIKVRFIADATSLNRTFTRVDTKLKVFEKQNEGRTNLRFTGNATELNKTIDRSSSRLRTFKKTGDLNARINISANTRIFNRSLDNATRRLRTFKALAEKYAKVSLSLDVKGFSSALASAEEKLISFRERMQRSIRVTPDLDLSEFTRDIAVARAEVTSLSSASGSSQIKLDVDTRGVSTGIAKLSLLEEKREEVDGNKVNIPVDANSNKAVTALSAGFGHLASQIRGTMTVLQAAKIPFLIAGIGGAIPTITAAAASAAGLALELGKAATGFTLVGGAAAGGAVVGLRAYTAGIASAVSASREAYTATHEHRMELLEQRRQQILSTQASNAFNREIDNQIIGLTKLQAAIGSRVFPMFTREMRAWAPALRTNRGEIAGTAGAVAGTAAQFSKWFRTADGGRVFGNTLGFINDSAIKGSWALSDVAKTGVMAFQPLIPLARNLQNQIGGLTEKTQKWVSSAEGQNRLGGIFRSLYADAVRLGPVLLDLGKGVVGIFSAIDQAGLGKQAFAGLSFAASQFKVLTAEGSRSRAQIDSFLSSARELMPYVGRIVSELASQFFRVADTIMRARAEGSKLTILQTTLRGIEQAIRPVGDLLISTFVALGPEMGPLISNFAQLANTFAGSTSPLVGFVHQLNMVMGVFNSLPGPMKTFIANLVGAYGIYKAFGGGTVQSFVSSLIQTRLQMAMISATAGRNVSIFQALTGSYLRNTGAANSAAAAGTRLAASTRAAGVGATAATAKSRAAGAQFAAMATQARTASTATVATGTAAAGAGTKIASGAKSAGIFARAGGFLKGALSAVALAFTGLSLPVTLAVAAIAGAAFLIYKNWGRIKQASQPAITAFNLVWRVMQRLGSFVKSVFTGDMTKATAIFRSLPGWMRPAVRTLGLVTIAAKQLAQQGLAWLQKQGQKVASWWNQNLPLMRKTAATVFGAIRTVIGGAIRGAVAVLRAVWGIAVKFWRQNNEQIISIAKSVWKIVRSTISTAIRVIGNVIKLGMQVITGDWKGAGQTLQRIWDLLWTHLKTVGREGFNILKNLFQIGKNVLTSIVKALWSVLKAAWSAGFNYVVSKAKSWSSIVRNLFSSLASNVRNGWDIFWDGVRSRWDQFRSGISSSIDGFISRAKSAFKAGFEAIKGFITNPIQSAKDILISTMNSILSFVNSILKAVHLPTISPGGGTGAGGGGGGGRSNTQPGGGGTAGAVSGEKGGIYRKHGRNTGLIPMARGGLIEQSPAGGIADGRMPRVVFGEAGEPEAYTVFGRKDNIPYGQAWADSVDMELVPKAKPKAKSSPLTKVPPGHSLRADGTMIGPDYFATGGIVGLANQIQAKFGVRPDYYSSPVHDGNDADFPVTAWGHTATGAAKTKGDSIASYASPRATYVIWFNQINSGSGWQPWQPASGPARTPTGAHEDHVHATVAGGPLADRGSSAYTGGSSAGPAGGGSYPNPLQKTFDFMWNKLVQPRLDSLDESMSGGFVLRQATAKVGTDAVGQIHDWIDAKIPDTIGGGSGGASGGLASGSAQTIGEALAKGGWPENLLVPASSTVWHESRGRKRAQNPSGARGLMQIMPGTARGVGADYGKLFDPVYNTSTGYKVYQQAGGFGPWVGAGRGGDYKSKPVYGRGGIAGEPRDHRTRLEMDTRVRSAFVAVADTLNHMAQDGETGGAGGMANGNRGGVGTGKALVGITNEAGPEAIVPRKRTPEGAMALRQANQWYGERVHRMASFASGGILGVSGGHLGEKGRFNPPIHRGVDVFASPGSAVHAWAPTEVLGSRNFGGIFGVQTHGYVVAGNKRYGFVIAHLGSGTSAGKYPAGSKIGSVGNIRGITPHAHWALSANGMPPPGTLDPLGVFRSAAGGHGVHQDPVASSGGGGGAGGIAGGGGTATGSSAGFPGGGRVGGAAPRPGGPGTPGTTRARPMGVRVHRGRIARITPRTYRLPTRGPVVKGAVPHTVWQRLLSRGWHGDPSEADDREALYPPRYFGASRTRSLGSPASSFRGSAGGGAGPGAPRTGAGGAVVRSGAHRAVAPASGGAGGSASTARRGESSEVVDTLRREMAELRRTIREEMREIDIKNVDHVKRAMLVGAFAAQASDYGKEIADENLAGFIREYKELIGEIN